MGEQENTLIANLRDAESALGDAASDVLDAEAVEDAATQAQVLAAADLADKVDAHADAEGVLNDAQQVHDDEIDSLNDEQAVIANVINMLRDLIAPGLIEKSGRSLLSLASLSDPKLLLQMAKVDPGAVEGIIEMLTALDATSQAREAEVLQDLADATEALGQASQAVAAAQGVLQGANNDLTAAEQDLALKSGVEQAAQGAKDSAESVHDAELPGLNNEQDVLSQVIAALRDLIARQA